MEKKNEGKKTDKNSRKEEKEKKKKRKEQYKLIRNYLSDKEYRKSIRNFIDNNCEKFNDVETPLTNEQKELFEQIKSLLFEPLKKICEENNISDVLFKEFIEEGTNDKKDIHRNHFIQLKSFQKESYILSLMQKRKIQIEEIRKKEEEERLKKEEEERLKREEEERLRKEEEERRYE